jgi:hypothetical protein
MVSVYVIEALEVKRVKVGVAIDPQRRLGAMQVDSPVRLGLFGAIEVGTQDDALVLEKAAHERLAKVWAHGEWFNLHADGAMQAVDAAALWLGLAYRPWKPVRLLTVNERREAQARELLESERVLTPVCFKRAAMP